MLSLCFPEEITSDGVMVDSTEMIDGVVSHDEYRDEMDMMTMSRLPALFSFSLFQHLICLGCLPLRFLRGLRLFLFQSFQRMIVACLRALLAQLRERDVETVDFGTEDQPRELKIGSPLSTDERDRLFIYSGHTGCFAWSYEDMPGLDPSIVQHHLPILPHARPVKQKLRRLHPRWSLQVKEEIQKQLSVGFISVVEYPEWLANVVPVPKKDGKVRVCVDFRDLNKASPKDDFPLPHIDLLVDTAGHSMLSFMDGFSGLRLNPKKCTFGVTSGKLLGHMVSERGIEVDPDKIKAILDMPAPKTEKEIRDQGYLLSPPVLVPPTPGRPLLLYLSVSDMALGCMLAQIDDSGRNGYLLLELRHYMTEYSVHLISRLDPLRYLFDRPALTGRLMRWLVLLTEFDIQPVDDDFPDEEFVAMTSLSGWCLYLMVQPISRIQGDWKTRDVKLRPYHAYLELLVARFDDLRYVHLPRAQNRFADALATLASSVDIPIDVVVRPLLIELRSGTYPEVATAKDQRALRHLATRFVICGDTLYRRSADDCCQFVQKCPECQIHGDLIHAPPSELHLDLAMAILSMGLFHQVGGSRIICKVDIARVASFIRSHIICYGVPHELISDRGAHFRAEVDTYCRSMAFDIIDLQHIGHRPMGQCRGCKQEY
ncbi:hypothetical protein CK203_059465 [Vitis vinifera]|uniref:Transposon Ty3-I Gag-Pol polyprotein n=1 Tax=Vitis vinifera TaxID=29760 RepID=A0A438GBT5_VITVI|nr:hypothetical protein CK203_059465 [Vitis vinifera]